MKIMYRPHRSLFDESVKETKIFKSLYDMFKYVKEENKCMTPYDVCVYFYCIETRLCSNKKYDWRGGNYIVCVNNAFGNNYIEEGRCPQAVGFCKFVEEEK